MNNALELVLETHLEEGVSIIRALMAKSDCSVDRNEEFYRAAQWMQLTQDRYIAALKEAIKNQGEHQAEIVQDENGYLTTQWAVSYIPNVGDKLYTSAPTKQQGEPVNAQVADVVFAELKKAGRFITPQDEKLVKDAVRNMKPLYTSAPSIPEGEQQ